ncbi:MAG TPA: amidohydrolase family protein, partial [Arenicellales bacterium]|nr:amidohydrolase family protein [Arenicellales bacterium]
FCLDRFGLRPLDYLESCDWIGDDVWLAHGIDFNADEIIRLGQYGISICHCPTSNMMLGSGFCPVSELEEAGVAVGLGVDGSASNDCSNLAQEMRQAWLLGRLHSGPDSMTHSDAIRLATEGSAACLGRKELGKIEVGARADLSLYRLDELRFSGAENPLAAIVQSGVSRADRVMIEGEWRVSSGEIIGIDLEQLRHQHDRAAKKLMSKYYLS